MPPKDAYTEALQEFEDAVHQHKALYAYGDGVSYPEAMSRTADKIEQAYRRWQEAKMKS